MTITDWDGTPLEFESTESLLSRLHNIAVDQFASDDVRRKAEALIGQIEDPRSDLGRWFSLQRRIERGHLCLT